MLHLTSALLPLPPSSRCSVAMQLLISLTPRCLDCCHLLWFNFVFLTIYTALPIKDYDLHFDSWLDEVHVINGKSSPCWDFLKSAQCLFSL